MVRQSDNLGYWSLFTCRSRKAGLIRHPNLSHGQTTRVDGSKHISLFLCERGYLTFDKRETKSEFIPLTPRSRFCLRYDT